MNNNNRKNYNGIAGSQSDKSAIELDAILGSVVDAYKGRDLSEQKSLADDYKSLNPALGMGFNFMGKSVFGRGKK